MHISTIDDLDEPGIEWENAQVLSRARVVWLNTTAIAADFALSPKRLVNGPAPSHADNCRSFIISHAAILSSSQYEGSEVNEAAPVTGALRRAARPPRYGRSLIVEARFPDTAGSAKPRGLLDIKGVGLRPGLRPRLENHKTGLLPLPLAIEELVNQLLVESAMRHANLAVSAIPVYALLDLGFYGRIPGWTWLPCAALVRAAHRRPLGGSDLPAYESVEQRVQLTIELSLRKYGITSVSGTTQLRFWRTLAGDCRASYGGRPLPHLTSEAIETVLHELSVSLQPGTDLVFDAANIQLARGVSETPLNARLVDFGHYSYSDSFTAPLLSLVSDRALNWGGVIWPSAPQWPQPDPHVRLRTDVLALTRMPIEIARWLGVDSDYTVTGVCAFALRLTRDIDRGHLTLGDIPAAISDFLDAAAPRLPLLKSPLPLAPADRQQ